MSAISRLRVGVVSYLNMLPLTHGLDALGSPERPIEVVSIPPAPMTGMMDRGELDIGMLPVGAVIGRQDWKIIGRSMIGSNGPVKSVLLIGAGDPQGWMRVHPDSHSRTSNILAQVLLANAYGNRPELMEPIPPADWSPPSPLPEGEAFVLIGTRALRWRHLGRQAGVTALDLGERWKEWTGLPFIFAVWATRKDFDPGDWMERFERLKRRNLGNLGEIVRQWPGLDDEQLSAEDAIRYLTDNIKFDLTPEAMAGLARFYDEGLRLGFFEPGRSPAFLPPTD
jgi:chorismate dehydratase